MMRLVLAGMGGVLLLTGIVILVLQISRKGKMVRVRGIIQQTGRDQETTHDNWAKVLITRPDGTQGVYMAQLRGQFAEENLNQEVNCMIRYPEKQRAHFLPRCMVEDGSSKGTSGLMGAILPGAIFLAIGAIFLFVGLSMSA